jgi:hypothetical protein
MSVAVHRAPVLTLWATVVAERLGHPAPTALTLGRAVAGAAPHIQVRSVGPETWRADAPPPDRVTREAVLLGKPIRLLPDQNGEWRGAVRPLPARHGQPADSYLPTRPAAVERYLDNAFGDHLEEVRQAMEALAGRYEPAELNRIGVRLYEKFRPEISSGRAKAALEVDKIRSAT